MLLQNCGVIPQQTLSSSLSIGGHFVHVHHDAGRISAGPGEPWANKYKQPKVPSQYKLVQLIKADTERGIEEISPPPPLKCAKFCCSATKIYNIWRQGFHGIT